MRNISTAFLIAVFAVSGIALVALFGPTQMLAQEREGDGTQSGLTPAQVETIVRDYLMDNPEILLEMQSRLEEKQQEERMAMARSEITAASDQIFNSDADGVIGNPDGDVTIVEFFDYNCGYCRRALDDMERLIENDENLRFVLKEFPILGPESQEAHLVSMAVRNIAPDQYETFHQRLLGSDGRADEEAAIAVARELGVDESALRDEMQNPEIARTINNTYELANRLQITGTPSYIVGDELVFGAVGRAQLAEKIQEARQ
ncbi:DsbA family protein [Chelativorans sp. YIM 93263]|uniref:DsbA family protein n=1 Tax=Chelativorans sp. YIM 93263 TaxID=2906648 RepID=UPI002379D64C|nr:DsbA family protein [Chelativorans sp. YIM 93263]